MTIDEDNPMWYDDAEVTESTATAAVLRVNKLRAALLDTRDLDNIPEPEPLIAGICYRNSLVWLQGKSGNGKSFVALDMAASVGTGQDWQGHPTTPGTVLYVAAEGSWGIRWRVRAWEKVYGHDMASVRWLPIAVQAALEAEWTALIDLTRELQPILVILDTQARITVGMEENAAKDMGVFVEQVEQLRQASNACVLIVHHEGRNGEHMRGSTALEGAASTVIKAVKEDDQITLSCAKQKDAEPFEEFRLRLVPASDSATLMPTDEATRLSTGAVRMAQQWRETFPGEQVTVSKIADSGIVSKATFYRLVAELIRFGYVEKQPGRIVLYRLIRSDEIRSTISGETPPSSLSESHEQSHGKTAGQGYVSHESHSVSQLPDDLVSVSHHPFRGETHETHRNCDTCNQPLLNTKSIALGTCARCRQENP